MNAYSLFKVTALHYLTGNFFDLLDYICSNYMMPLGGFAVAILAGWVAWPMMRQQITAVKPYSEAALSLLRIMIAFLAPILVAVAIYQGLFGG